MRIQGPALPAKPKPWYDWARNPYLKTFCLALSGRESAASESISALTHLFADIDPHEDETWRSSYLFLFEASMILKDQELTDKIIERFEGNVEKTTGANFISIIPATLEKPRSCWAGLHGPGLIFKTRYRRRLNFNSGRR